MFYELIGDDVGEFERAKEADRRDNDEDLVEQAEQRIVKQALASAAAATAAGASSSSSAMPALTVARLSEVACGLIEGGGTNFAAEEDVDAEAALAIVLGANGGLTAGQPMGTTTDAHATAGHTLPSDLAKAWRAALIESLGVLERRATAVRTTPRGHDGQISLIVSAAAGLTEGTQSAIYVTWTDATASRGRRVQIDPQNRIVYSVPIYHVASWENCFVVHPAIGKWMRKLPPSLREVLPPDALHLQRMWDCALGSVDSLSLCSICKQDSGVDGNVPKRCPLCLLVFHAECVDEAAPDVCAAPLELPQHVAGVVPAVFDGNVYLCPLCRFWQGA